MENELSQKISSNGISKKNNNLQINDDSIPNINTLYLSNEIYIKLFYNSKNSGLNKNFPLNVIYNKKKSKTSK